MTRAPARSARAPARGTPAPKKRAAPAAKKAHGGARAGAGRKRGALPQESLDRLGEPPVASPLLMARWWSSLLGEIGWLRARGMITPELMDDLRSLAATAGRLVPEDLRAEVDRVIKEMEAAKKPEAQGPKLEVHRGEQPALRGIPR